MHLAPSRRPSSPPLPPVTAPAIGAVADETRAAHDTARRRGRQGFTLIELIIVIAVIGILASIVIPRMKDVPRRAQEAVLKTNLRTLREAINQRYADKGSYPPSLETLVEESYLRRIPKDPITKSTDTWEVVYQELDFADGAAETDLPEDGQPGIIDVFSGAEGPSLDGEPFSEW